MIEVAIFVSIALILDNLPMLNFKIWANGGSVNFSMIPIFIIAFRWRLVGGLLAGFIFGILQIAIGTGIIFTPMQAFVDYVFAFTVIGTAGLFAAPAVKSIRELKKGKTMVFIIGGVFVACLLRFIAHFVAGVFFFSATGLDQEAWIFSFIYNGTYMLPNFIISGIIMYFLFSQQPRLLAQRL